jgi:hypothetical protein
VINNLAYSEASYRVFLDNYSGSTVASNNLLTDDPGFTDSSSPLTGGLRLSTGSPAINAGISVPVFTDYDGLGSRIGGTYDLGAYLFE